MTRRGVREQRRDGRGRGNPGPGRYGAPRIHNPQGRGFEEVGLPLTPESTALPTAAALAAGFTPHLFVRRGTKNAT